MLLSVSRNLLGLSNYIVLYMDHKRTFQIIVSLPMWIWQREKQQKSGNQISIPWAIVKEPNIFRQKNKNKNETNKKLVFGL